MKARVSSEVGGKKEQSRFIQPLVVHCKDQARRASTLQTSAETERDGGQLEKCSVANQEAKTFTNDGVFFVLFLLGHFIVPFLRT